MLILVQAGCLSLDASIHNISAHAVFLISKQWKIESRILKALVEAVSCSILMKEYLHREKYNESFLALILNWFIYPLGQQN